MKKNNFRFTTETFHINHIESPVNQYIDQITEKIFNNNCLSENKHQFKYVTIWLDQVRIAMLKTEIYSNEDVFCYLKPRLEFASSYKVIDLLNFVAEIVDSLYSSNKIGNKYLVFANTAQGRGKIKLPKIENLKFKQFINRS